MKLETKHKEIIWCIILSLGLIIFFATGCKTKYVPIEYKTIEYKDRLRVDSVYNRDTVNIYRKNDTVYLESIKWRERFRQDTLTYIKTDSIPYPVEIVKEINVLTKWQRIRLNALNILLMIVGVYLFIKIKL